MSTFDEKFNEACDDLRDQIKKRVPEGKRIEALNKIKAAVINFLLTGEFEECDDE